MRILPILAAAAGAGLIGVADVSSTKAVSAHPEPPLAFHVPFRVGEKLTYQAKVNFVNAGSATMSVEDVEPVRGHDTYHTIFNVQGT
jgi:uncharacterized protein DUF3108